MSKEEFNTMFNKLSAKNKWVFTMLVHILLEADGYNWEASGVT
jgi:hypothetical protein